LTVVAHTEKDTAGGLDSGSHDNAAAVGILNGAEGPVESARISWTPNEALDSLEAIAAALSLKELQGEKEELAPMPPGWDMAYVVFFFFPFFLIFSSFRGGIFWRTPILRFESPSRGAAVVCMSALKSTSAHTSRR
jgi:hypothetical protein